MIKDIRLAVCLGGLATPAMAQTSPDANTVARNITEVQVEQPGSIAKSLGIPGVRPQLELTTFVQALASGDGKNDARFASRADLFVDFSSNGLGLWDGTVLRTHTELRQSESGTIGFGGALWPANVGAVLPLTGNGVEVTSIYIAQNLGTKTNLLVGKINALDLLAGDPFFGGLGTKRFQKLTFVGPPSGVVPPTIMGAVLVHQIGSVGITAMAFDPDDRSGDYWVDGLFATGVNLSLGATWKGTTGGRITSVSVTAAGSTKRGLDLNDVLAPPGFVTSTKKGSYNLSVQVGHSLSAQASGPGSIGIYAKAAIADGNPNLIKSSIIGGFSGQGLFAGRPQDRFGIGAYFYNFSNALQDATDPLVDFNDELGTEAYYAFAL